MRNYIELFFFQRNSDLQCFIGRTEDEAYAQKDLSGFKNSGKLYVLLDKDRIFALVNSNVQGGTNNIRRGIPGDAFYGNKLFFPGGSAPALSNKVVFSDLYSFESPRDTYTHTKDKVKWSLTE